MFFAKGESNMILRGPLHRLLAGHSLGDILGAGVESMAASEIRAEYGQVRDFLDTSRGFGCYTDDTQMTLALAISLVERGGADARSIGQSMPPSTNRGEATAERHIG